jgi:hypothetical protein
LFQIDARAFAGMTGTAETSDASEKKPVRRVEYFWLCGSCAEVMTLGFERGKGVITVGLTQANDSMRKAAVGA